MKVEAILLLLALLLATVPAKACLSRQLIPPPVLAEYMSHTLGASNDPLQAYADAFNRDKAYYDAIAVELCGLGNEPAQQALINADAHIMDQLHDKWQKTGAALATAKAPKADAPPACKTEADCKDYCIAQARKGECLVNGAAACNAGTCSCLLTCR